MTELDKLIEAVERGDEITSVNWSVFDWSDDARVNCTNIIKASSGSLDAAKALHEALLDSGLHAEIEACCTRPRVRVVMIDEVYDGGEQEYESRSWLLAILKAYRAKEKA